MLDSIITSQTRIKLLRKFFLNGCTKAYLRGLEIELGESTNAIRVELNRLENAGLLLSDYNGNKKLYQANLHHPLYKDIHSIILKETRIDQVIEKVINKLGKNIEIYLTGDFAKGKDSEIIELIIAGENLNEEYFNNKIRQVERIVGRKIRYTRFSMGEINKYLESLYSTDFLQLWSDKNKNKK